MSKRTYATSMPVEVTVHDDGHVTYYIDVTETAASIWNAVEAGAVEHDDETVTRDTQAAADFASANWPLVFSQPHPPKQNGEKK